MSRALARSVARKQYDRFSRDWRREKRMSGAWGKPGRKPTFNQWYHMHHGDSSMMKQSSPSDVQEYLGLDPWKPDAHEEMLRKQVEAVRRALDSVSEPSERGVITIPMIGGDA